MEAARHKAPVDGNLPEFSVIQLAQARKQQGIQGGFGRIRLLSSVIVTDYAVHERTPVEQARTGYGKGTVQFVSVFSGFLVQLVEMDAAVNADANSTIDNGKLPVLLIIYLGAAHQYGRTYGEVLEGGRSLVAQAAEIFLETEQLAGIRLGFFRGVCVSLGEGITLKLVVPVLGRQGEGHQKAAGKHYEPSELHLWSRAFMNSSIWASDSNLMVRTPLPSRLRRREIFSPKYLPTFSRRR